MPRHLDEMRQYIDLSTVPSLQPLTEEKLVEHPLEEITPSGPHPILEDLSNVIFKLQAHRVSEGSDDYAEGIEEAITLATNMLTRIVERHGKTLS
jgi:hypothetical protein